MDHCRERQGWTTVCSFVPERDGKDQGEDSPNQAGSRAGSFAVVDLALRLFCLILFWRLFFIGAATLRSVLLRYTCAPTDTRRYLTTVLPSLGSLNISFFPSIFVPFPFRLVWRVRRFVFFFRLMVFCLVTTGWRFSIIISFIM